MKAVTGNVMAHNQLVHQIQNVKVVSSQRKVGGGFNKKDSLQSDNFGSIEIGSKVNHRGASELVKTHDQTTVKEVIIDKEKELRASGSRVGMKSSREVGASHIDSKTSQLLLRAGKD